MPIAAAPWKPPYSVAEIGVFSAPAAADAAEGDILLLRAADYEGTVEAIADAALLPEVVQALRRSSPGSPVAVWIPPAAPEHVIDLARAATAAHVRAILGGPSPDAARLRVELTDPQGLGAFVLRWAADAGYLPQGVAEVEIRALLEAAPNVRTLQRLARERQEATRTWRSRLRQMGLPTPHAWLGLAHMLHQALHLQRNHDQPLQRMADQLGYSDVTLMSHRFKHVFRMAPGAARGWLGAEPLLHRWFQRATREVSR